VDFSGIITNWYEINKRDLPWRKTTDPYLIWVSEVILQQTRVENGISYYLRFTERFPDLKSLAEADQQEVLKIWQGMGYYSRARNLHETAQFILKEYEGRFPDNYNEIRKLKGVGDYTAAAILSFSFNKPFPVVDGNVYRVLSRVFGISTSIDSSAGRSEFKTLAESLIDVKEPGIHNQAIMEFGALQCVPGNPDCILCPLLNYCEAYKLKIINKLPVKNKKAAMKNRFFHYFHFVLPKNTTLVKKRGSKDIWQSLYEFPMLESERLLNLEEISEREEFKKLINGSRIISFTRGDEFTHVLTHQKITARFFQLEVSCYNFVNSPYDHVSLSEIQKEVPLHRLMTRYFEKKI
jgi:A/G-specific adenine glycosylase